MSMERKRKEMELKRVVMAREEQEFRIEEKLEEIARLEAMIEIQKKKEMELITELKQLTEKGE